MLVLSSRNSLYAPVSVKASQNSTRWRDLAFEEHLCGFKFIPIKNNATVNISVHRKMDKSACEIILRSGILGLIHLCWYILSNPQRIRLPASRFSRQYNVLSSVLISASLTVEKRHLSVVLLRIRSL